MERQLSSGKMRTGAILSVLLAGGFGPWWGCGDFTIFSEEGGSVEGTLVGVGLSLTPDSAKACSVETVVCSATAQMDPNEASTEGLAYAWTLDLSGASGSEAELSSSSDSVSSFKPDVAGSYKVSVTVSGGAGNGHSDEKTVTASSDPIAEAGEDQIVQVGATVALDGSGSRNPEDGKCDTTGLTFSWEIISSPDPNDTPVLSDPAAEKPTFVADLQGEYAVQLTVTASNSSGTATVGILASPSH